MRRRLSNLYNAKYDAIGPHPYGEIGAFVLGYVLLALSGWVLGGDSAVWGHVLIIGAFCTMLVSDAMHHLALDRRDGSG